VQTFRNLISGGLAIITGAQTNSPVVALSGPNAMISRRTFDPPLRVDDINRLTFNIVPDRDPVPRSKYFIIHLKHCFSLMLSLKLFRYS